MKLKDLLAAAGISTDSFLPDAEITLVTSDTRRVIPGTLFVAVRGGRFDGHDHLDQARLAGAVAAVTGHLCPDALPQIPVTSTRFALGVLCSAFWGKPSEKLMLYGVTGTNGKTTVSTLLSQVLGEQDAPCGLIGTVENRLGRLTVPAKFTTPDPFELHPLFSGMVSGGCRKAAMEVSSMALDQERLAGCHFQVGIFTNLSQDHLDYHHDMESYFQAKCRLFALCDQVLVNADDEGGRRIAAERPFGCDPLTFSRKDSSADFFADGIRLHSRGCDFVFCHAGQRIPVTFSMPGEFAVENALAVLGAAVLGGMDPTEAVGRLSACHGVSGRMELLAPVPGMKDPGFTVLCDYAHSDDSLEKAIATVRSYTPDGKIRVLFGPPGMRDRTKRPKMAAAVAKQADFIVLTADDPRDEPLEQIFADTEPTLRASGVPYRIEEDRFEAIHRLLDEAEPGDVVMLCGKGHETHQVLADRTLYFNEHEIVRDYFRDLVR